MYILHHDVHLIQPSKELAKAFGIQDADQVLKRRMSYRGDGASIRLAVSWVPKRLVPETSADDAATRSWPGSLVAQLRSADVPVTRSITRVHVRISTKFEKDILALKEIAYVLVKEQQEFTTKDLVGIAEEVYPLMSTQLEFATDISDVDAEHTDDDPAWGGDRKSQAMSVPTLDSGSSG